MTTILRTVLVPAALAVLFVALLLPAHPRDLLPAAFLRLPLELPLIVLLALVLRGAASVLLRVVTVAAVGTLLLLRLADLGSRLAFDRAFSPLVELHLIGDGWNLASQAVGRAEAVLAVTLAIALFALLCTLLYRGLGAIGRLRGSARAATGALAALALLVGGGTLALARSGATDAGAREVGGVPVQARLASDIVTRVAAMRRSIADQNAFVAELADDPLDDGRAIAFEALAGRDVVIVFVESYGRSFIDGERFRDKAHERLASVGHVVAEAGLHARSAWLTSPIRGGRSWLAQATFLSGLHIDNQARFDRLVASPRRSLNRLFGEAGWRTAGLMPAIREAWPEGRWRGYERTFDAAALDYRGEPFGWVTMPDQYTLSAFERLVRNPPDAGDERRPLMAEIALISSHAPWTPLPELVPWESVGDGSVFDGGHRAGAAAAEVWRVRERVRDQYALSLDYTLETLGEYLARYGRGALFVIVGDHQPASIVNGWDATADVPIHLVADDPALLARLPDALWSADMLPGDEAPSRPMESMRETLARTFAAAVPDDAIPDDGTSDDATPDDAAPDDTLASDGDADVADRHRP